MSCVHTMFLLIIFIGGQGKIKGKLLKLPTKILHSRVSLRNCLPTIFTLHEMKNLLYPFVVVTLIFISKLKICGYVNLEFFG